MNDVWQVIIMLIICFLCVFVGHISTPLPNEDWRSLKQTCEAELPRNQVCEMQYVVKEEK